MVNYLSWSVGFIVGNCLLHQFSVLPSWTCLLGIGLFCWPSLRRQTLLVGITSGFIWTWGWAYYYLQQQVAPAMIKQDLIVTGRIASIPHIQPQQVTFNFRVDTLAFKGKQYVAPRHLRLSWYQDRQVGHNTIPHLAVGQTWQFTVRLKPPHGFRSPGASDYSQQLFAQHVDAVGYIHTKIPPLLLNDHSGWRDWINHHREILWYKLQNAIRDQTQSGIIFALALGERAGITAEEWQVLQATGTSHLVAISGLHVGLVASLMLGLCTLFWRYLGAVTARFPARISACIVALLAALIYSAMAGFAVPTQRALIMLALVMYGIMQRRSTARIYILLNAAVIILFYDPLATLSVSFWLSFIAVAAIFYLMQGRQTIHENSTSTQWRTWGRLQWGISCLLIPVTLWYFQQAPLVSPIANALAIPWVSFIVVPLTLLGCMCLYIWPLLGEQVLQLAAMSMQLLWPLLEWFAAWPHATWAFSITRLDVYFSLILGAIVLFMPRGIPGKWYGVCALLPIWLLVPARPTVGEVWIDVLDVGQGLSVLVRTAKHNLVFDTGDRFSEQLTAADAVILPFLRSTGIDQLDTLVVSHDDRDHKGGAEILIKKLTVQKVYAGEHWQTKLAHTKACIAGESWYWDLVKFEFLHPDGQKKWEGNNASCVLKVSSGQHSILITGDIESSAEYYLTQKKPEELAASILIAGHHGSATSSSKRFVHQVNPDYVIFAAGYLNRFKFPNPKIVNRYQEQGVIFLITGKHGTIHLAFDAAQLTKPTTYLEKHRRYWQKN